MLPTEIVIAIIENLGTKTICHLRRVCKQWKYSAEIILKTRSFPPVLKKGHIDSFFFLQGLGVQSDTTLSYIYFCAAKYKSVSLMRYATSIGPYTSKMYPDTVIALLKSGDAALYDLFTASSQPKNVRDKHIALAFASKSIPFIKHVIEKVTHGEVACNDSCPKECLKAAITYSDDKLDLIEFCTKEMNIHSVDIKCFDYAIAKKYYNVAKYLRRGITTPLEERADAIELLPWMDLDASRIPFSDIRSMKILWKHSGLMIRFRIMCIIMYLPLLCLLLYASTWGYSGGSV